MNQELLAQMNQAFDAHYQAHRSLNVYDRTEMMKARFGEKALRSWRSCKATPLRSTIYPVAV